MQRGRVVGVDVGGTKILAGVVAPDGTVLARREHATPLHSQAELLETLVRAVEEVADGDLAAAGFGVPTTFDQREGRTVASVNIPLADVDLRGWLRDRLGVPVGVDNDANAAAIAEWVAGAGRGTSDMLMLTLGTGVGGGLILDGRVYRGCNGGGGEVGHIVVVRDGEPCDCGGHGHLEAYASGSAADARARDVFGPAADAADLVRFAREGDARAIELLADIGAYLGVGIASLVNVLEPELVVVGGGFAEAGDFLLEPARAVVRRETMRPARERVRVVRAQLGTGAGMIGAALVGYEALAEA